MKAQQLLVSIEHCLLCLFTKYYNSLIRKVQLGIDSVVFWGTYYKDTSNLIIDLKHMSINIILEVDADV